MHTYTHTICMHKHMHTCTHIIPHTHSCIHMQHPHTINTHADVYAHKLPSTHMYMHTLLHTQTHARTQTYTNK